MKATSRSPSWLAAIVAGRPVADVPGIAYLDAAGVVRRSPARPFVRDLDALPRPAWDLVDVEAYRRIWQRRHGCYAMNLATTRGCPFHCNWCAKPIYGQRYAVRSPANVVDEIAWLRREFQPDSLAIVDDVFALQPGWLSRFAGLVQASRLRVPFRCLMRADQIDADTVPALVASGCRMVWMGAESGSQRILDAMEKGVRVEQIRDAARRLQAAGVGVGLFLQFGYPGERWDDIEATLRLVHDLAPRRYRRVGLLPASGHEVSRAGPDPTGWQAELVRFRRPRDDVSRDLRARVLSRAAPRRASRLPRPAARGAPALGMAATAAACRR